MLRSAMKSRTGLSRNERQVVQQREIVETLSEQHREAKMGLQDMSAKLEKNWNGGNFE